MVDAGAAMLNDVSGLRSPELASVAASSGAALVLMHTRAAPKEERFPGYADPVADVESMLRELIDRARALGVPDDQLVDRPRARLRQDAGRDGRRCCAASASCARSGRPLLLAVSRKYFVGAITGRPPLERIGGTLAALAHGLDHGAAILRVHDVAAVSDFLRVRAVLARGSGGARVRPDRRAPQVGVVRRRPGAVVGAAALVAAARRAAATTARARPGAAAPGARRTGPSPSTRATRARWRR